MVTMKTMSASPCGILDDLMPPRLISSKFPLSPPNAGRLRLGLFGGDLGNFAEIPLVTPNTPQLGLGEFGVT